MYHLRWVSVIVFSSILWFPTLLKSTTKSNWDHEAIRTLDKRQRGVEVKQQKRISHTPLNNLIQEREDDFISTMVRAKVKDNR
jgi:hypothetical protein